MRLAYRLINGYDTELEQNLLKSFTTEEEKLKIRNALSTAKQNLVNPFMSIQDAIDLARFLAKMTSKTYYFLPVPNYVGGAVDIATITRHQGFKWIKRKLYYKPKYNQ